MSAAMTGISRRTLIRAVIGAAILGVGIATVHGLERAMHATFDKPPAPLSHPLALMKRELGNPVRYISTQPDEILSKDVVETLGTNKYLVRQYQDTTVQPGQPGRLINLNINFYESGDSTPHVPEICWAAGGWLEAGNTRNVFTVPEIVGRDGKKEDLRMRLISFLPPGGAGSGGAGANSSGGGQVYSNVAYVFHVNGKYVATTQEVISQFWKASYAYAYHCKIEVTPMETIPGDPAGRLRVLVCPQEQTEHIVSDFIREALPEIEACLPDPSILTQPPGAVTKSAGK